MRYFGRRFDYGQEAQPAGGICIVRYRLRGRQPALNRKVPGDILKKKKKKKKKSGLDKDEPAKTFIMDQDQAISEKSGVPPLQIKSIKRSGK